MTTTERPPVAESDVLHRLSLLDRFLPAWIGAAMVLGLLLGAAIPQLDDWLDKVKIGTVSLPIAIGLLLMMYPVLAKVRYRRLDEAIDRRSMTFSLVLNWVIGPALMFTLAWLFLSDLPEYRTGLIIVGLARCIAMVLIWNDLACGDRELAAVLVAINSLFQIAAFSVLGWFYLEVLPGWLGLDTEELDVSMWEIAKVVLVFLGIPLVAGFLTRLIGERTKGSRVVRAALPATHRSGRPVRPAVHDRRAVRVAGRQDHQRTVGRRPHRAAAARLLRDHVVRCVLRSGCGSASRTTATRRSRSRLPGTTSNWRSPLRSACSA